MNLDKYQEIKAFAQEHNISLVAVSKTKPAADMMQLYQEGQRDFGENYVQELIDKQAALPKDIHWHFIGHLQSNKVKLIAPFVHLIHAVDSFKLLQEINKQAARHQRRIDVLLQLYVASEESKFGMDENELLTCLEYYTAQKQSLSNIRIRGLMGMASFTDDKDQIRKEFALVRNAFQQVKKLYFLGNVDFDTCSMGMSSDYTIAVEEGSTIIRIGSMLFGSRN